MNQPHAAVTVDCFVRASSLVEPVDQAIETLREYDRTGVIDGLEIRIWPDALPLSETTENSDIVMRYRLFRAWADEKDVHLGPAFTRRERRTLVSDEADPVLVLPEMCLAIHVDGELTDVVPHRTGTATYTVDDALADLADRTVGPASDVRNTDQCPACGNTLVTGQELYTCPTCSWTGAAPAETITDVGTNDRRDDRAEPEESGTSRTEDVNRQQPL